MWLRPVGYLFLIGAIIGGFAIMDGPLAELWHPSELVVIIGAGIASFLLAAHPSTLRDTFKMALRYFSGERTTLRMYEEVLGTLEKLFKLSRSEGAMALDKHMSDPFGSDIFRRYPLVLKHDELLDFMVSSMNFVLMNPSKDHDISVQAAHKISLWHRNISEVPKLTGKVAEWLPGFGIMAAILGVILTMTTVGGPVEVTAKFVGAALTGTFYGILFAFAIVGPFTHAIEVLIRKDKIMLDVTAAAISAFSDGLSPSMAIEIAKQRMPADLREQLPSTKD
jgi:chemotaxis protein MotA